MWNINCMLHALDGLAKLMYVYDRFQWSHIAIAQLDTSNSGIHFSYIRSIIYDKWTAFPPRGLVYAYVCRWLRQRKLNKSKLSVCRVHAYINYNHLWCIFRNAWCPVFNSNSIVCYYYSFTVCVMCTYYFPIVSWKCSFFRFCSSISFASNFMWKRKSPWKFVHLMKCTAYTVYMEKKSQFQRSD